MRAMRSVRIVLALLPPVLAGCASSVSNPLASAPPPPAYQSERFEATAPFARGFAGRYDALCEGARRALMGQGYMITGREPAAVHGRKFFQPQREVHVQLAITVSCVDDGQPQGQGMVYATAWQDQFVLKRNANNASLGVSAFGSISLPLNSSEDSLVKIGTETITDAGFYERFYALLGAQLAAAGGRR